MITFLTRPTFKQAQAVKSLQTDGTVPETHAGGNDA